VVNLTTHMTTRTRVSAPVQEGTSGHHACGRSDASGRQAEWAEVGTPDGLTDRGWGPCILALTCACRCG
jgi:hypothetical protein